MDYEPPFLETYKTLFQSSLGVDFGTDTTNNKESSMVERCELPMIDLSRLNLDHHLEIREECMNQIIGAARKWGFFQVVNHGIPHELLQSLQFEQMKVFHCPLANKSGDKFLNLPPKSYRWGNPFATNLKQLSWSEAIHIYLSDIVRMDQHRRLRWTIEAFAAAVAPLAEILAEILAQKLNIKSSYFQENCSANTSFLRLNRYPPCPVPSKVFGLLPHSDSSFITMLYQDQVGGLQLMKDGNWLGVKPNPQALIVNIGDLFQALSNGVYKSIKHRVVASEKVERFSAAYFYSPSSDAVIQSFGNGTPALYRNFTFGEYKGQTEKDVQETGDKVGLSRFLLQRN